MVRNISVLILLLSFLCISEDSCASARIPMLYKTSFVSGSVIFIDAANNEIMIKDYRTGADTPIVVTTRDLESVKIGDDLKVEMEIGSNQAHIVQVFRENNEER